MAWPAAIELRGASATMRRVTAVEAIPALRDNYIWVLRERSGRAAVVDPGEAAPVERFLETNELKLSAILVTHHHADHTGGIDALARHRDVPVFGPADDGIAGLTSPLEADARFEVPGVDVEFETFIVPGHTRGQAAYYGGDCVFTGDTLFSAGCGRLFEGTPDEMWQSLCRLRELPDHTRIYCGHEYTLKNLEFAKKVEPDNAAIDERSAYARQQADAGRPTLPSTVGDEKRFNPFLRADRATIRDGVERLSGQSQDDPAAVFAALRVLKDHF
jgi:hydroxyacylglutathione hydrolase